MKRVSGKQICRILERKDWRLKNVHGSHHVYMKDGRKERISVPVHGNRDLKLGMLMAIMKIAGIGEEEL
ncbi:MAG: type II toxin-antitoxin system HicA family toxin [Deltaproteobacteria bacterium]|nr:type II toxin-antitoxin system HicA family toxin [Deltaproteobacteria bacterium]